MIDFGPKEIRYYDSLMGQADTQFFTVCAEQYAFCPMVILTSASSQNLARYLNDESEDKKKQSFPTTDWQFLNVTDLPEQMNDRDCGTHVRWTIVSQSPVHSRWCVIVVGMFMLQNGSFISQGKALTFTQDDMRYFRRKVCLEIMSCSD